MVAPVLLLFVVAVLILGMTAYNFGKKGVSAPKQVCTLEGRTCPDGSTVGRTGPNCEFAECPAPTPKSLNIIVPSGWKVYQGDCAYKDQVDCPFAIGYPEDWLLVDNVLYPDKKIDPNAPYIVLGVGGRGLGDGFKKEVKEFAAGEATYWKKSQQNGDLLTIMSFSTGEISYIFEGYNLKPQHEELFLKMMNTFAY